MQIFQSIELYFKWDKRIGSTKNTYLHEFTVHLGGQTFATGDIRVFLRVVAGEERREQREERREQTPNHTKRTRCFLIVMSVDNVQR